MTSDGQPYYRVKFKSIIEEQVLLGYLTKGGISYSDSDQMSPHERKLALDAIKEILEGSKPPSPSQGQNTSTVNDPKTGLTSLG